MNPSPRIPILSGIASALAALAFAPAALAGEKTFTYYRWTPTKLRDGASADSVQVAEFQFYRFGSPVSWAGASVANPGGDNPSGESPPQLIDGDTGTKWLDFNKLGVIFTFPAATTIDSYRFATANDSDERDPVSWTLEGSADQGTWTLIDTVTNYPTTTDRSTFQSFDLPLAGTIAYPNFDLAGAELALLDAAAIVNAFATLPQGGNVKRLRVTPDLGSSSGAVWSRDKQQIHYGFDATFGFQFTSAASSEGADGMAFVIHNDPQMTAAMPTEFQEFGLPANALNFSFDSYQNGGEASAARLVVLNGTTPLATVDLTTVAGLSLFTTDEGADLSDTAGTGTPFQVRIRYVPGDLDVLINNIQVVSNLNVDLAATGALNGDHKAYVGFTARTGGAFEAHDITSWFFTPTAANYANWVGGYYGLSDPAAGADPDGDGLTNLMEYVLNGNPSTSSTAVLPIATVGTGNTLVFSFVRRAESKQDTVQTFQFGTDLVNWTDTPVPGTSSGNVEILPNSPTAGLERVTITVPAAPGGTLFGRLRVTQS